MKEWKRALSLVLAVMLIVFCLPGVPLHAHAEESAAQVAAETTEETVAEAADEATEETAEETTAEAAEFAEETVSVVTSAPAMTTVEEDAQEQQTVMVTHNTVSDVDLPDNEELYAAYVEQLFYGGNSVSFLGEAAREQLNPLGQQLYDLLKENILSVAAGETSSASVILTKEMAAAWKAEIKFTAADGDAAFAAFLKQFEMDKILDALLHDCPYDLYWFNKIIGIQEYCSLSVSSGAYTVTSVTFSFAVSKNYQPSGYNASNPTVNTSGVAAAKAASSNAQDIVEKYANSSDYEKLLGYKTDICTLADYNWSAANSGNFELNNDPWQLVYVFDGNAATKVVCEGYAKAFQYLCDLTTFRGDVSCYSVTGTMSGGTGAGNHMWNIVTIGGKNYMVDVTNSDDGTEGQDGRLFLAGTSGSIAGGYNFKGIAYKYDAATKALWGTGTGSILNLSATNFDPSTYEEPEEEDNTSRLEYANFAELQKLASRTYDELTYITYIGEGPLVIEDDLTLPENLGMQLLSAEVVVAKDANLTTAASNELMIGKLTVEGKFINNGNLHVPVELNANGSFENNGEVIISGKLNVAGDFGQNGVVTVAPEATGVTGAENITYGEGCVLEFAYIVKNMQSLKAASSAANAAEDPHWAYSIDVQEAVIQMNESVSLPDNCTMWIDYGAVLTVERGYMLDMDCYAYILDGALVVNGTLNNNGYLDVYYDDGGVLTVADGGKYTGSGSVFVNSDDMTIPAEAIHGLNPDDFDVKEYNDAYGHYWELVAKPDDAKETQADLNGDGKETEADAAYLLWHTLFPDLYPIPENVNADLDGDSEITNKDVVILLWYTLFPGDYFAE